MTLRQEIRALFEENGYHDCYGPRTDGGYDRYDHNHSSLYLHWEDDNRCWRIDTELDHPYESRGANECASHEQFTDYVRQVATDPRGENCPQWRRAGRMMYSNGEHYQQIRFRNGRTANMRLNGANEPDLSQEYRRRYCDVCRGDYFTPMDESAECETCGADRCPDHQPCDHEEYSSCASCGESYPIDHMRYCDDDECEAYYCDECDCSGNHQDRRIHDYGYRPHPYKPKGNFPTEVLIGVELEVGYCQETIADVVCDDIDPAESHLYLKEDGSIEGAEIVTHPMTLAWARDWENGHTNENNFDRMLNQLSRYGCRVDDGYGLHVHVSRNAFRYANSGRSHSHQLTWLLFIYRNVEHLQRLARRESDQWAAFRTPERGELIRKAQGPHNDDRYIAVNCQNERTYELRFFGATLDNEEFWAALEFADASVNYTRTLKANDALKNKALTWSAFTKWLADQGTYPNLLAQASY